MRTVERLSNVSLCHEFEFFFNNNMDGARPSSQKHTNCVIKRLGRYIGDYE